MIERNNECGRGAMKKPTESRRGEAEKAGSYSLKQMVYEEGTRVIRKRGKIVCWYMYDAKDKSRVCGSMPKETHIEKMMSHSVWFQYAPCPLSIACLSPHKKPSSESTYLHACISCLLSLDFNLTCSHPLSRFLFSLVFIDRSWFSSLLCCSLSFSSSSVFPPSSTQKLFFSFFFS